MSIYSNSSRDHEEFLLSGLVCELVVTLYWFHSSNYTVESSWVHCLCHYITKPFLPVPWSGKLMVKYQWWNDACLCNEVSKVNQKDKFQGASRKMNIKKTTPSNHTKYYSQGNGKTGKSCWQVFSLRSITVTTNIPSGKHQMQELNVLYVGYCETGS